MSPARNVPELGAGKAAKRLRAADWRGRVDHPGDGDRQERIASAHRGAATEVLQSTQALESRVAEDDAGRYRGVGAGAVEPPGAASRRAQGGAGVAAAAQQLQPCAGDALGLALDRGQPLVKRQRASAQALSDVPAAAARNAARTALFRRFWARAGWHTERTSGGLTRGP
jgi:hypothetical protein